jgi:hypothetical protein
MAIQHQYALVQVGSLNVYAKSDEISVGDGETKDIPLQTSDRLVVQITKPTVDIAIPGLNQASYITLEDTYTQSITDLVNGITNPVSIDFGGWTITGYYTKIKRVASERIQGQAVFIAAAGLTLTSSEFR